MKRDRNEPQFLALLISETQQREKLTRCQAADRVYAALDAQDAYVTRENFAAMLGLMSSPAKIAVAGVEQPQDVAAQERRNGRRGS